ncbi:hypothetical protein [Streptomyces sp. NPDC093097]
MPTNLQVGLRPDVAKDFGHGDAFLRTLFGSLDRTGSGEAGATSA